MLGHPHAAPRVENGRHGERWLPTHFRVLSGEERARHAQQKIVMLTLSGAVDFVCGLRHLNAEVGVICTTPRNGALSKARSDLPQRQPTSTTLNL